MVPQFASHVPRIVIGSKGRACGRVGSCVHIINGLCEHEGDGTGIASINASKPDNYIRGNVMRTKPLMNGTEPMVRQPRVNEWEMSWNPDDGMWCVENPYTLEIVKAYKERRNAMAYARNHIAPWHG